MAVITKRYRRQVITDDALARRAGHSSVVNANYTDVVDVDYDDTLAGAVSDVDELMAFEGFFPDALAPAVLVDSHGERHAPNGGDPSPQLYAPPEKWTQQNVAASQSNASLFAMVSTSFDTIPAIRAGSVTGLSTRFTEAITDATADSAIVKVTINGTPGTLQVSHSSGVNPSGGRSTQASGVDTFVAGDLLGVEITTLGTFVPTTTTVESWIDLEV